MTNMYILNKETWQKLSPSEQIMLILVWEENIKTLEAVKDLQNTDGYGPYSRMVDNRIDILKENIKTVRGMLEGEEDGSKPRMP